MRRILLAIVTMLLAAGCMPAPTGRSLNSTGPDTYYAELRWPGRPDPRACMIAITRRAIQQCEMTWNTRVEFEARRVWWTGEPLGETVAAAVFTCAGDAELRFGR